MTEMSTHIISFGKKPRNLILSLEHNIIGSFLRTASEHINRGSTVLFHCNALIWGSAKIDSEYFFDDQLFIWRDKIYPHRFKIKDVRLTSMPISLIQEGYNNIFRSDHGPGWAFKFIFTPKPIPDNISNKLLDELARRPSSTFEELRLSLDKIPIKKLRN